MTLLTMTKRKQVFNGERLRQAREAHGLTQDELSKLCDFGQSQMNKYELGKSDPSAEILTRLCRALGVTADWLLGLVDAPTDTLTPRLYSKEERKLIELYRAGDIPAILRLISK